MSIKKREFFTTMTAAEFRRSLGMPVRTVTSSVSKYHNVKTVSNGVTYDSKKEAKRGAELELMRESGVISDIQRQVPFELQPKYVTADGRKIREIKYVADFVYKRIADNKTVVEDVKGMKTDVYKLKRKMFEYKYPDVEFVEIT